jgi:hypothetical protein
MRQNDWDLGRFFSMGSKDMAKEIIAFGLKLDADTCGLRLLQLLQSR